MRFYSRFYLSVLSLVASFMVLNSGCGGGNSGGLNALPGDLHDNMQTFNMGGLITRIAGTAQTPVTAGGSGTVVTGVAGGLVSSIVYARSNPTLAETRLAFQSQREGNYDIYTMDALGSDSNGLVRLTNSLFDDEIPAWSPDGTKIAFSSKRDGNSEIYVMNADGTGVTRLTNNVATDYLPSWSPDGTKIAFTSYRDGDAEIFVMNADGSGLVQRTSNTFKDDGASWSPDGTKIAFQSDRDGDFEIYTMNPDGSGVTQLTFNTAVESDASWSPDSTKIAFASKRDGNYEIYVMNAADGAGQTRLTNNTVEDSGPCWSPDGTTIAFTSLSDGNYNIWTMNPNGSNLTRKTTHSAIDIWPRWSPLLGKRELIGANGQLGTSAAGFLYGQNGDAITSVVVFDTLDVARVNTRVSLQTSNGPGNSNYVFNVTSSDKLTRLAYTAGNYGGPKVIVGSGGITSPPTGAIVSFNSTTGQVSSVLPYISTRGAGPPAAALENGVQVLRGKFLGVWDATGKNRAPQGATDVQLQLSTGEILAIH